MSNSHSTAPLANYWARLLTPAGAPAAPRARLAAAAAALPGYVFQYLASDLAYGTPEYAASGSFAAVLPPWLNDLSTVTPDWRWTAADNAASAARAAQGSAQDSWLQANVPGQTYSSDAITAIQQRYANGVLSPEVFGASAVATMTANWVNDDAEFARQRLGGANTDVIAKYRGSNDALAAWLGAAAGSHDSAALLATLQAANSAGTLFVCDYAPVLGNVAPAGLVRSGQYFAAPFALFAVSGGALLPLAIQVDSVGRGYVFTPQDDANAWLLAKLWVGSADAQWWFSGAHLFNTHTVVMQFAIAAAALAEAGTLAADHPVLVLLKPHLAKVFDINTAVYNLQASGSAGAGIYQAGQFCDQFLPTGRIGLYQIVSNLFADYSFDAAAFDSSLAARQLDTGNLPVPFPYRDDGTPWWNAIANFVSGVIEASYADDAAVAADAPLNAWFGAVQAAFNHDGVPRYTWTPTKAGLKRSATVLFHMAAVQHTAVNNSMFPHWGYLPNGAFAMTAPPPAGPGVTDAQLLASLPDPQAQTAYGGNSYYAWPIQNQIDFVVAGTSAVDDVAAGDGSLASLDAVYAGFAAGSGQAAAVAAFQAALWDGADSASARIAQNQSARIAAFRQANPSAATVPNSVSYYYLSPAVAPAMNLNAPVMNGIQI
ncbi:lipoxygenase family protein [Derxia lacustris]|uniref:lipoxygenase family protein n=2 Tax=Derxia lacustris TaxID=764842 RepID=UPI000A16E2C3|nr:lipoxygenase family protein [Derxia lacustris]